jgi:hypothetical protein
MGRLRMLLASIELVEAVHRHEPGQHEAPDLAQDIACGAPGVRSVDVAACNRQKVFRFDPGNVADMRRRAPTSHVPSAFSGT